MSRLRRPLTGKSTDSDTEIALLKEAVKTLTATLEEAKDLAEQAQEHLAYERRQSQRKSCKNRKEMMKRRHRSGDSARSGLPPATSDAKSNPEAAKSSERLFRG